MHFRIYLKVDRVVVDERGEVVHCVVMAAGGSLDSSMRTYS
jgi:hypothetical protein